MEDTASTQNEETAKDQPTTKRYPYILSCVITFILTLLLICCIELLHSPQYKIIAEREVVHEDGSLCKEYAVLYKASMYSSTNYANQFAERLQDQAFDKNYDTLHFFFYSNKEDALSFSIPDVTVKLFVQNNEPESSDN